MKQSQGFALLLAIIVVGVVLSVGLVMLELTIKQVRLAATTKDSEIAFHAANAGTECARYWRRLEGDSMVAGDSVANVACFDAAVGTISPDTIVAVPQLGDDSGDDAAYVYDFEVSWGSGDSPDRCTRMRTLVMSADVNEDGFEVHNVQALFPEFPDTGTGADPVKTCSAGSQCTVVSSRGYNKPCPSSGTFGYGVVERNVLLQF